MCPEEIWANYSSKLKNYIIKHVADRYEAEDILQEVGIRIQTNADKLKNVSNIEAWLYRVAYNLIVDYFRRTNKYSLMENIREIPIQVTPEQENYNKETAECLLQLVELLPKNYREAIIESDYNGKKQKVLGQKWGISYSGSKTRIQRARKKLKDTLLNCCQVESDNSGNIIEFRNKDNNGNEFSCIECKKCESYFMKVSKT